jgi:hypothetical protein
MKYLAVIAASTVAAQVEMLQLAVVAAAAAQVHQAQQQQDK